MKGKYTLILSNLIMLAVGIILVVFCADEHMAEIIAISLGVLFLAPSLFSTIMLLFVNVPQDDARYNPRYNLIPVIGGLSFGLVIVFNAAVFVSLLKYLFAVLLIVGGLYYVFYLVFARSRVVVPSWYYILPSVVTMAGLVALWLPIEDNSVVFLTTGISLIALVITSVVIVVAERAALKAKEEDAVTTDVVAEQVEDKKLNE